MRIFCSCAVLLHLVAAQDPCDQARQPEGVVAGSKCLQPQGQWKHRFAAGARAARAYTLPNNRVGALVSGAKCPQVDATQLEDLWPEQHFRGPLQGPRQYFKRVPRECGGPRLGCAAYRDSPRATLALCVAHYLAN
jgi:hypothetical protein